MPIHRSSLCLALLGLVAAATAASAQAPCPGDCNDNDQVVISEIITCVNIAQGTNPVTTCAPCDVNSNGEVAINELIAIVGVALNSCDGTGPTPTATPDTGTPICGNSMREADEICDDGNNLGGDGCAANCTDEIRRETNLDPTRSKATVQLPFGPIPLNVSGSQALIAGAPRDVATMGPGNVQLFKPGEFPVVIRASDVRFNPVIIPGLACGCIRGVPVPEFGEGISGVGSVGCGDDGLTNVSFKVSQDHNTTPGNGGNSGSAAGLPDDPSCTAVSDAGGGIRSEACLEGTGEMCSKPENEHIGVCISPRVFTFFGGAAARGATYLRNSTSIGLLQDRGACQERHETNGDCSFPAYGPDCKPCTDDDVEKGTPNIGPTTSGTAQVVIYDSGSSAGSTLGFGAFCGSAPCIAEVTGEPTDCDALMADRNAPLTGTLVTAFSTIDAAMVGDNVVTTTLAAQR